MKFHFIVLQCNDMLIINYIAAVSAVHALALVALFQFKGNILNYNEELFSARSFQDPDLIGVFPLLTVSGIMLTPILMWSNAVRDHRGQAIILWYAFLLSKPFRGVAFSFTIKNYTDFRT